MSKQLKREHDESYTINILKRGLQFVVRCRLLFDTINRLRMGVGGKMFSENVERNFRLSEQKRVEGLKDFLLLALGSRWFFRFTILQCKL